MSKVIWHTTMSLDGYIAGPDGKMSWMFGHSGLSPELFREIVDSTGAVLTGRSSYDHGKKTGGKVYGGAFGGPIFVLTHRQAEDPDPMMTFISGDIGDVVAKVRATADGKNVILVGADVARQCARAGLVDELFVHIVPALVGEGVRLFDGDGDGWIDLDTVSIEASGDTANLRYRLGAQKQFD